MRQVPCPLVTDTTTRPQQKASGCIIEILESSFAIGRLLTSTDASLILAILLNANKTAA
jgi:hypothetical protein